MKKSPRLRVSYAILALGFLATTAVATPIRSNRPPQITARSLILIDNSTGQELLSQNPDQPLPPASTTKVLTALIALESGRLDESMYVSEQAAETPPSKIGVRAGWKVRLYDLVYALMLNSANDASVVIAEGLAGSVPNFAARMNIKAHSLGARNSHFNNPNGLPDDEHYSTARDLATIFGHAMRDPLFRRAVSTKVGEITPTAGSVRRIKLHTHNRLLDEGPIQVVGKTGWTRAAKKCFVGTASQGGREFTFSIMGSRDLWGDIRRLLDYAFEGGMRPEPGPQELLVASASKSISRGGGDRSRPEPVADAGRYSIKVGAFRSMKDATAVSHAVARHGYSARIEKVKHKRGEIYRVAVGSYDDRREAQRAAKTIQRTQRVPALVVAHR